MDDTNSLSIPRQTLGSDDSWEEENPMPANSPPSTLDDGEDLLLKLFQEEKTLVKVIQNHDWKQFIDRLGVDENDVGLKTSTTMLPSNGRYMRLYGKTYQYSVGFVWNLNDIESSVCWCWPAGFYAKTEFNVDPVTNRLSNGLQEALVTLEQLHINNAQLLANNSNSMNNNNNPSSSPSPSSTTPSPSPPTEVSFNEVFAAVTVRSLVGVICRSREYQHLLLAMGVRDTASRLFGIPPLPIVLHDPQTGVRILTHHHQQQILSDCIQRVSPFASFPVAHQCTVPKPPPLMISTTTSKRLSLSLSSSSSTASTTSSTSTSPSSPSDLDSPPHDPLSPAPLARCLPLRCDDHHVVDLRQYTHTKHITRTRTRDSASGNITGTGSRSGSSGAGSYNGVNYNDNNHDDHFEAAAEEEEEGEEEEVFSAEDQMRFMGSHGGVRDCIAQIIGQAMQRGDYLDAERLVLTGLLGAASTSNSHSLETIIRVVSAIVVDHPELYVPARVDRICVQVCNNECMLVGLGAYKAIGGVATGDVLGRLHQATAQIEEWLRRSRDSYFFCLESFTAVSGMEEASVVPFLSGKAIANRQAFLQNLRQLEADAVLTRNTGSNNNNSGGNNNSSGKNSGKNRDESGTIVVEGSGGGGGGGRLSQALYVPYLRHIITLISSMHSPCLRLQLLQFVLGLDDRYSKRVLEKSTHLALDIVMEIMTKQQQSQQQHLPDQHHK